jgi:hypothetical protein
MVSRTRMIPNRSVAYWQIRRERAVRAGEQSASLFAVFDVPDQMGHRVWRGTFARRKFTTVVRDGRLRCGEQESLTTSPVDDGGPVDRRVLWFSVVHAVRSASTAGELSLRSSCPAQRSWYEMHLSTVQSLDSAFASQIDC